MRRGLKEKAYSASKTHVARISLAGAGVKVGLALQEAKDNVQKLFEERMKEA